MRAVWRWLPVVAWSAVILFAADDSFSNDRSGGWLQSIFGRELPILNFLIRKLAHLVEYAILGALAVRGAISGAAGSQPAERDGGLRVRRSTAVAIAIALVVAILDETRQSFSLYRSGSPWDVLLDVAGAAAGIRLTRARMSRHA